MKNINSISAYNLYNPKILSVKLYFVSNSLVIWVLFNIYLKSLTISHLKCRLSCDIYSFIFKNSLKSKINTFFINYK